MADETWKREDAKTEQAQVEKELSLVVKHLPSKVDKLATAAVELHREQNADDAMRVIQRLRYTLQVEADKLMMVLHDMHFLSTGSDDFDLETWFQETGEHDYAALDFIVSLTRGDLRELLYAAGSDLGLGEPS